MTFILIKKIISLFLVMLMGIFLVKSGVVQGKESRILSVLSLYLITPCMILSAFQTQYSNKILSRLFGAFITSLIVFTSIIVVVEILGKLLKMSVVERVSAIYSNAGNLLFPIVTALIGSKWLIYCTAYITVQRGFMWTHAKILLSGDRHIGIKKILFNSNMLAIIVGFFLFLFHIYFPEPVRDALSGVGDMAGPMAMLITGILVGGMDWKKMRAYRRAGFVTVFKLIIVPLLVIGVLKLCPLDKVIPDGDMIFFIVLLATITPTASATAQMAQIYGQDAEYANIMNLTTTICCIVTMPLMVMLYQI